MILRSVPKDLTGYTSAAAIFLEVDGEILLLKRSDHDTTPSVWGQPGGGMDQDESKEDAVLRETFEETGIRLHKSDIKFIKTYYVKFEKIKFMFNIFHAKLDRKPEVKISHEHTDYIWIAPKDALKLDLIEDEDECIRDVFGIN